MGQKKKSNQLSKEVIEALELTIKDEGQRQKVADIIGNTMMMEPMRFKDRFAFFIKHAPGATITAFFNYAFQAALLWVGFMMFWPLTFWECFGIWTVLRGIRNGIWDSGALDKLNDKNKSK